MKTDAVDSATLAQLLRADLIPAAHMITPDRRPLRDLLRTRARLVEKRVSAANSIERLYEKYNVAASPRCHRPTGIHYATLRAIQYFPEVRAFATPKARKSNKHVARAIVAKEIARICYYMLRDGSAFNGRFKGAELSRTKKLEWPRRASPDL